MTSTQLSAADHPVLNPLELHFETRPMRDIKDIIIRWVFIGAKGGCILGNSQVGKSTALVRLSEQLKDRAGRQLVSHYVSIPRRDVGSVTSLYRLCCLGADLPVKTRDPADVLQARFVDYLRQSAEKAEARSILLLVDEMQRLTHRQLEAFCEIYEELRWRHRIRLTVILVGNDLECSSLLEGLKEKRYAHVAGRFFLHMARYHGLSRAQDLREVLQQYDSCTAGAQTYTEFFLSTAFNQGFRLESLTDLIWEEYQGYRRQLKLDSWGMSSVIATVNTLLTDFLPKQNLEQVPPEVIRECLNMSGIESALVKFR